MTKKPIWGGGPLKKVRFCDQISCFVAKRFRMHNRDTPTMGILKHFSNFFEMAYRHIADEKKLPLTLVLVSFGQELLDEHTNFPTRWLLVFQFIYHDGLKTGSTDLKEFAHAASIGQSQRCQGRSKKCSSVERFRIKKDGPRASPGPSKPLRVGIRRGQDARATRADDFRVVFCTEELFLNEI